MELFAWLGSHWIDLAQTGGIIAALLVVRKAMLWDARVRQIGNSIQLTEHHRALWERLLADPQLGRILDSRADIEQEPITPAEEMFVVFLILHVSDTYYAMQTGFYPRPEGIAKDVQQVFSLPIPRAVWEKVKGLQESEFAAFVERCLATGVDGSDGAG